jgi:hypothetical protein
MLSSGLLAGVDNIVLKEIQETTIEYSFMEAVF